MSEAPVPTVVGSVEEIEPIWLSSALGFNVETVHAECIGTGQTSATYRLTIHSDTSTFSGDEVGRGDKNARRGVAGHRSEVGFYTQLAPVSTT